MASLFCQTGQHVIGLGVSSALRPARLVSPASSDWVYDDRSAPEIRLRICEAHPLKDDPYVWINSTPPPADVVLKPDQARALKAVLDALRYSGIHDAPAHAVASDLFAARTALRTALVDAGWDTDPRDPGESPTQLMRLALMDVLGTWGDRRLRGRKAEVIERVRRALNRG